MDKCREEFEEWFLCYKDENGYACDLTRQPDGNYSYARTNNLWIGWQASRESMKAIKLPSSINTMCISTTAKNKIISAITSAGYKVEE